MQHRGGPVGTRDGGRSAAEIPAADAATERRGVQLGLAAYLIWGLLTIYWKQLDAFEATELIGWRMLCAGVAMAVVTTVRRRWTIVAGALRSGRTALRLVAAALLLSVNWWSYVYAVVNDRVIETALGYFMAPLATMLLGVLVLREHAHPAQRAAFVLACAAVVVMTAAAGRVPWIALLLAGTWSLYGLSKRRVPLGPIDGLTAETLVLVVPAAIFVAFTSLAPGVAVDSVARTASAAEWPLVVGTGVITALPLVLFAGAARTVPFTVLGPLNLLVPIINFLLGWVWYGEDVPAWRFAGFALVWCAVVLVMADRIASARRVRAGTV